MYHQGLVTFVVLFICAKLMGLRLPFYSAALLAVSGLYLVDAAFKGYEFGPYLSRERGIHFAVALVLFFLLDRSENKTGRWLVLLAITVAVFTFVL